MLQSRLLMASQHVGPLLLTVLTGGETFNRPAVETILSLEQLLLFREVHALELVYERNVPQITINTACDQVPCTLHIGVI